MKQDMHGNATTDAAWHRDDNARIVEDFKDRLIAAQRENERLRQFIQQAHDACADPARPRQHVGEILAAALS